MRVFVSCTTQDLAWFRDILCDKPGEWWGGEDVPQFVSMSDAKAEPIPPVDWSVREAAGADAFVLLLGKRYGALAEEPDPQTCGVDVERLRSTARSAPGWEGVEEPGRLSYTHWEALAAAASGVPVLVFCPDRTSTDEDLRAYGEDPGEGEPGLLRRQESFAAWVRSRFTEDHFRSRADLLNKVRAALKRLRARPGRRRVAWLLVAAAATIVLYLALAYQSRVRTAEIQQREQVRLEKELTQQKYAVGVGASLAMLGQSSARTGGSVFERARQALGFPPRQVQELSGRYASLEEEVRAGKHDYEGLRKAREELLALVSTRAQVLTGGDTATFVRFGHDLAYLLILLEDWTLLKGDALQTAVERLAALKSSARKAGLPPDLARSIQQIGPDQLATAEGRQAVAKTLGRALGAYDMEPASQD